MLLHGGGQTRGSWKNCCTLLAGEGFRAIAIDARGHGESDWAPDGDYTIDALIDDLRAILAVLPRQPVLVGASMGGSTALALAGETGAPELRGLVLVDIAPKVDLEGTRKIVAFMTANPGGFASLEDAAAAISEYNPHRPRPKDLSGLRRNLREVGGRFHWHWDPALLGSQRLDPAFLEERLSSAARNIAVPTLLLRGGSSDVVGNDEVEHFRSLVPTARFVDVAGAGHMIAGDRNDAFNAAILGFLTSLR